MSETCPNCHVGHLQAVQTVLVRFYGGTMVHVPSVAAHKCDICGETFFDQESLRRVDLLIGESGPPPNRHVPAPPDTTPGDSDVDTPAAPQPRPK